MPGRAVAGSASARPSSSRAAARRRRTRRAAGVVAIGRGRSCSENADEHQRERAPGTNAGPVDAQIEHLDCGICDSGETHGPRTAHPAGRRRAVDPDPALLSRCARTATRSCRRPTAARRSHRFERGAVRPRRARRDDAPARRARGLPPPARALDGPDHHAHRQGRGDRQGRSGSSSAPTTTSPSRSRCASSARACGRRCAAAAMSRTEEIGDDAPLRGRRPRDRLRQALGDACAASDVELTFVEFEILTALARNPGRVFTRDMLLTRIWGDSAFRDPRTIDVHIRHLREKLERDAKDPEYLFTVRGVGYRFRDKDATGRRPGLIPRSIRSRLALAFFADRPGRRSASCMLYVAAVAAGSRLRDEKLDSLAAPARDVHAGRCARRSAPTSGREATSTALVRDRRRPGQRARDAARASPRGTEGMRHVPDLGLDRGRSTSATSQFAVARERGAHGQAWRPAREAGDQGRRRRGGAARCATTASIARVGRCSRRR